MTRIPLTIRLLALLASLPLLAPAAEPVSRSVNGDQLILHDVPEIPDTLVERLNRYQNVRSAGMLDWTRNGESLYVRTRFGAVSQLHRVDAPGGVRRQLTWFREPIGQVVRRSRDRMLAITLDRGGGEQDQIFLFDPRTAERTRLTNGESRNRLLRWSRDGRHLAFQSTRRNGRSNDLWWMDPDRPGSEELLLEAPPGSWYAAADFSDNGRLLLVQQFLGVDDSRIHVLDLETRELSLVAGNPEWPSANKAIAFDRRGNGFYFITNVRGRAAELAWQPLDRASPTEYLTAGSPWDVSKFVLSENGSRGAFVTNEEGISRLYLLDTSTHR